MWIKAHSLSTSDLQLAAKVGHKLLKLSKNLVLIASMLQKKNEVTGMPYKAPASWVTLYHVKKNP